MKDGLKALLCLFLACFMIYVAFFDNSFFKSFDLTTLFGSDDEEDNDLYVPDEPVVTAPRITTTKETVTEEPTEQYNDHDDVSLKGQREIVSRDNTPGAEEKKPDYHPDGSPDYREFNYSWVSHDGRSTLYMTLNLDKKVYDYYKTLQRYYDYTNYRKYITDEYSQAVIKQIADCLRDLSDQLGYDNNQTVREAISFVQLIPYVYDVNENGEEIEYPKYPIETLFDNGGDCEDTSILLAGILKELDFGVCFIHFKNHVAVGIQSDDSVEGTYFEYRSQKYTYIETTGEGWKIGQLPDEFNGETAEIIML